MKDILFLDKLETDFNVPWEWAFLDDLTILSRTPCSKNSDDDKFSEKIVNYHMLSINPYLGSSPYGVAATVPVSTSVSGATGTPTPPAVPLDVNGKPILPNFPYPDMRPIAVWRSAYHMICPTCGSGVVESELYNTSLKCIGCSIELRIPSTPFVKKL